MASQKLKCDFCYAEVLMLEGETCVTQANDEMLSMGPPEKSSGERERINTTRKVLGKE